MTVQKPQIKKIRINIVRESSTDMTHHKNEFLFSDLMIPVRQHQAYEEMLDLEKEFAGSIYYQRCLDKRL